MKSLYDILGVNQNASMDEIKKAYKTLAIKHHPDRCAPEDREKANSKFQEISEAYRTLSDPEKKKIYDRSGQKDGQAGGEYSGSNQGDFHSFDFSSFGFGGGHSESFGFGGFEDLFSMFTSQRQPSIKKHKIDITVEESFNGTTKHVIMMETINCTKCQGRNSYLCGMCRGQGKIKIEKKHEIIIPPGTKDDDTSQINATNLIVFKIISSNKYAVSGFNLIINMTISYKEFIEKDRVVTFADVDGSTFTYKIGSEYQIFTAKVIIPHRGLWHSTKRNIRGSLIVNLSINFGSGSNSSGR